MGPKWMQLPTETLKNQGEYSFIQSFHVKLDQVELIGHTLINQSNFHRKYETNQPVNE